jgi:siroheme synthase (precorrin-2 oxidase/ferrochelatase)
LIEEFTIQTDPLDITEYAFVFFPVGLNLRGRKCVVIGNDREAIEKDEALREVGAQVLWIKDAALVRDGDVSDAFFVISTPQDPVLSARLRELADEHKFLLCAIDQPKFGFVAMQAIVKAGPVRIAISTGGISPRVGRRLREALQRTLDHTFVRFIDCLHAQRERNRRRFTTSEERRNAMIDAAEGFELEAAVRYPPWFEDELAAQRPEIERA